MSYYARTTFSGTGDLASTFTFSWDYIESTHVKVTLDGAAHTAFTLSSKTVTFTGTAPPLDAVLVVYRESSPTARIVDYTAGSVLTETVLDQDSQQAFFLVQEALDTLTLHTTTEEMKVTKVIDAQTSASPTTSTIDANLAGEDVVLMFDATKSANAEFSGTFVVQGNPTTAEADASTWINLTETYSFGTAQKNHMVNFKSIAKMKVVVTNPDGATINAWIGE